MKVLLVEDEAAIRRLVRHELQNQGLTVVDAATLGEARSARREQEFEIIILDLTLPDGSGLDLLEEVRGAGSTSHVIILSGLGTEADRVRGLVLGADDYVIKPFSILELNARVLAIQRRLDPAREATLHAGHLTIDLSARAVSVGGRPIEMTPKEFDLLAFLAARPGTVFSRDDLLRTVWRSAPDWQLSATVTEHVRRLRGKIEPDPHHPTLLRTVRGAGYRFDPTPPTGEAPAVPTDPGTLIYVAGQIVSADDAAIALLAGPAGESLLGRRLIDFVAPSSMAAAQERIRTASLGASFRSQILDVRCAGGREVPIVVSSALTEWNGERAGRLVLQPVADPASRLRHLVTGIATELSDAVVITDVHSHIRSWNKAAERLYGWAEQEILGRHILDILRGPSSDDTSSTAWEALEAAGHWHGELSHCTRDGSTVVVRASTTLVRDADGEPIGVVSVNRPVTPEPRDARGAERSPLEAEIRRAIDDGEFEVYYQPVVGLDDRIIVTVEALVRWNHPDRGLLSPASFIDVAERSGLILEVGAFVMDAACRQAAAWRRDGIAIDISINLSTRELGDAGLLARVTDTIAAAGLDASALWLEVTETGIVEDVDGARQQLERLAELGVRVAIDDFGTGWASLTYLKEFPVRALKIDRSFVDKIEANPQSTAIVRSVVSLGEELNLFVVAEGIETEAQHEALRALGCRLGQGYLYGRPVPAGEFPVERAHPLLVTPNPDENGSSPSVASVANADRSVAVAVAGSVEPPDLADVADVYEETVSEAVGSMLRALLRIRSAEEASELLQRTVRALGGTLVLASEEHLDTLPIDLSLGVGPPLLLTVEPYSVARMQLERILPGLVEDARDAVNLLHRAEPPEDQSPHDPLTGLFNRRELDRILSERASGSVVMLDFDHFKEVNDSHGQTIGDEVITAFAIVLSREVGEAGTCCRIAGEEFAVVLDLDPAAALVVVERLRAAWVREAPHPVTFSAGVAPIGEAGGPAGLVVAEQTLHRAKRLGRDRSEIAVGAPH